MAEEKAEKHSLEQRTATAAVTADDTAPTAAGATALPDRRHASMTSAATAVIAAARLRAGLSKPGRKDSVASRPSFANAAAMAGALRKGSVLSTSTAAGAMLSSWKDAEQEVVNILMTSPLFVQINEVYDLLEKSSTTGSSSLHVAGKPRRECATHTSTREAVGLVPVLLVPRVFFLASLL